MPAYARGMGSAPGVPLRDAAGGGSRAEEEPEAQAAAEEEVAPEAGGAAEEGEREIEQKPQKGSEDPAKEGENEPVPAVPNVSAIGETEEVEAHARSLNLHGRTRARFSSSFRTVDLVTERGEGCTGCRGRGCVHVTGTLESTFNVATTVRLPAVPRNLTRCQRENVRDAINNVLAPHEQEHVDAFNTYGGTVSTPIDMTVCSNAVNARISAMHRALERTRRAEAKALSAALDPFNFDVDLDCEETAAVDPEHTTAGAGNPEEIA